MKESIKLERAFGSIPFEIVVQYSDQTDNIDVLKEKAAKEAEEEGITVLEVLRNYTLEVIETYELELLGHVNYDMRDDDPDTWKKELNEIKRYLKKLEHYIA